MGIDTHLYINGKWDCGDLREVITSRLNPNDGVKIRQGIVPDSDCYTIDFSYNGKGRSMFVHPHTETPIGSCTMLSLGYDEDAVQIMQSIGDAIGGILEKNDCTGGMEMLNGYLDQQDGLAYFLKDMVFNKKPMTKEGGRYIYAIPDINNHIKEWSERVDKATSKKYGCF